MIEAKVKFYRELLGVNENLLTDNEVHSMFLLSKDRDIQKRLEEKANGDQ
jgi:hypothetical protein